MSDELAGQTMTGFCFVVRGEARLRCDERFVWWYGDSDLERQVRAQGKQTVCVGGARVSHFTPMQSTRGDLLEQAKRDEAAFAEKWGLDPDSLWLALHPEFGA
jgi:GT2 family glycosyltransferase